MDTKGKGKRGKGKGKRVPSRPLRLGGCLIGPFSLYLYLYLYLSCLCLPWQTGATWYMMDCGAQAGPPVIPGFNGTARRAATGELNGPTLVVRQLLGKR